MASKMPKDLPDLDLALKDVPEDLKDAATHIMLNGAFGFELSKHLSFKQLRFISTIAPITYIPVCNRGRGKVFAYGRNEKHAKEVAEQLQQYLLRGKNKEYYHPRPSTYAIAAMIEQHAKNGKITRDKLLDVLLDNVDSLPRLPHEHENQPHRIPARKWVHSMLYSGKAWLKKKDLVEILPNGTVIKKFTIKKIPETRAKFK